MFGKGQNNLNRDIAKRIMGVFAGSMILVLFLGFYMLGLVQGYKVGQKEAEDSINDFLTALLTERQNDIPSITPTPTPTPTLETQSQQYKYPNVSWGGPELWEAVNDKRVEYGVNRLENKGELCTIASIRLNELLELGKLDGHEGFSNLTERRRDLAWIFENYSTLAEFLAVGGDTAEETVSLWENTLGHKKLLTGGEYVWGCIYAQNTFAVAITAF